MCPRTTGSAHQLRIKRSPSNILQGYNIPYLSRSTTDDIVKLRGTVRAKSDNLRTRHHSQMRPNGAKIARLISPLAMVKSNVNILFQIGRTERPRQSARSVSYMSRIGSCLESRVTQPSGLPNPPIASRHLAIRHRTSVGHQEQVIGRSRRFEHRTDVPHKSRQMPSQIWIEHDGGRHS